MSIILRRACRDRVYGRATSLIGSTGPGESGCVYALIPFMTCRGFQGDRETVLLADSVTALPSCNGMHDTELVRPTDLVVSTGRAENHTLLVKDLYGKATGFYEDDDSRFRPPVYSVPCLAYGRRERRTYCICLSRTWRVTIQCDVEIVPSSFWHPYHYEGTHWVVQITDADEHAIATPVYPSVIQDTAVLAGWSAA